VKGELLFVDCVDEGGRKGPPVNVKWDENGAAPPIRVLKEPPKSAQDTQSELSRLGGSHTSLYRLVVNL